MDALLERRTTHLHGLRGGAVALEPRVEIGADGSRGAGCSQRVAGAAPADTREDRLANCRRRAHRRLDRGGERPRVLARLGRDGSHVGRHVRGVLPLDQPRRHHALRVRVLDPVVDQALNRRALHAVGAVLPERVVQVRPDVARCVGVRQRVARAAFRDEQLLAGHEVAGLMLERATTEADHDQNSRDESGDASQRLDHTLKSGTLSKRSAGGAAVVYRSRFGTHQIRITRRIKTQNRPGSGVILTPEIRGNPNPRIR